MVYVPNLFVCTKPEAKCKRRFIIVCVSVSCLELFDFNDFYKPEGRELSIFHKKKQC